MTLKPAGPAPAERRAALLLRAGQALASPLDLDRTLADLAGIAVPDLADVCSIHLRTDEEAIRTVARRASDPSVDAALRASEERSPARLSDASGIGRAIWEGRTAHHAELTPEAARVLAPGAEDQTERLGLRSLLVVPVPGVHGALGCILLAMGASGRSFGPEDIALAEDLALRAASAIENARLQRAAQEQVRRADFLAEASRRLAASLDPAATMREVIALAVPAIADWAIVYVRRADGGVERAAYLHSDPSLMDLLGEIERRWPQGPRVAGPLARVIEQGESVVIDASRPDVTQAVAIDHEHRAALERVGAGATMIVPLSARGTVVGALVLAQSARGREFTAEDVRLAEELALRAGAAFENARVHERLSRLQEITSLLTRPLTAPEVAAILVEEASRSVGASLAVLSLVDAASGSLDLLDARGMPEETRAAFARIPLDADLPLAQVARTGEDVHVPSREALRAAWKGAQDVVVQSHAWAVLALRQGGRTTGALLFGFETARAFDADTRAFLRAIADQAAQALARATLAEAALVRQQLLESQNEATLDGIFFQDAAGRPTFFNRRLLEIFGVPAEAARMERIEDRLARTLGSVEDPAAFQELAMRMEREPEASLRFDLRLRDGRILDAYTTPVTGPEGDRLGRAWYYRDVTDARRLERELVEARQELAHREKLAAMGSLVSGVAHEIRTPLAYAANHAQVLDALARRAEHPAAPQLRESASAIVEAVERINRLVQDLRRFTKTRGAPAASVAADEAAQAAIRLFEATHPARVRLQVAVAPAGRVAVERVQLQQVLLNLLENAADASPSGARVKVRVWAAEGEAVFEVQDEGPGVEPDVQARMWEPFFTTKPDGTGLGLSIVRRIVESHGGRVACESAPGKGTVFRVAFPLERASG